jgi:acyl carrier protein
VTGFASMGEDERCRIIEQLKPALALASNGRAKLTDLTEGSHIIEDVGLASLDLLELRFELENRWRMQISDEQAIGLRTIGDIVDVVARSTHPRDQ